VFLALFIGFSPLCWVNYDLENLCKLLCGVCICTSDAFVTMILWVVFVSVDMCCICNCGTKTCNSIGNFLYLLHYFVFQIYWKFGRRFVAVSLQA